MLRQVMSSRHHRAELRNLHNRHPERPTVRFEVSVRVAINFHPILWITTFLATRGQILEHASETAR